MIRLQRQRRSFLSRGARLETLESRLLLTADVAVDAVGASETAEVSPVAPRSYQIGMSEFLDSIRYEDDTRLNFQSILNTDTVSYTATVVGGSASGTPADSPAQRIAPNTPAGGLFGGVGSLDVTHPSLGRFICTGTVIAPTFVLTAGHCFDLTLPDDGQPDAGITAVFNLNDGGNLTSTHVMANVNLHPDFEGFTTAGTFDDLAVVELATPVPAGTPMYAVSSVGISQGQEVEFVGYGLAGHGDTGFSVLPTFTDKRVGKNHADLFVKDDEGSGADEAFLFDYDGPVSMGSGFLGGTTLGNDIEASVGGGDSGGPVFVDSAGSRVLAGINTIEFALDGTTPPVGFFGSLGGGLVLAPYASWISSIVGGPTTTDIAVSVTESTDTVVAGSGAANLVYSVVATNNGPSAATGVMISDVLSTLPAGVTLDSVTASSGTFTSPTWDLGSLAVGASETLTLTLTVDATAANGTDVISNSATLTTLNETDSTPANDSATESTSITNEVDLTLVMTESADPVQAGSGAGNLVYEVTVTNSGLVDALGVVVGNDLTLPAGVTRDSVTSTAGTFSDTAAPDGNWVLDVAVGSSATLTITMTADASTLAGTDVISNAATVTGIGGGSTLINVADDAATHSTSVIAGNVPIVDLVVGLTESVEPAVPGSGLTYVLTVGNNGPDNATGVTLNDVLVLPAGVTIDSITASVGTYDPATDPTNTWTLGNLISGGSETLTVVLAVDPTAVAGTDVISSTATVSSVNESDSNAANDSAAVATSIAQEVDLVISVAELSEPVVIGSGVGNLTYVTTVTNSGPSDASGVLVLSDLTLPTGVTLDSVTASVGTYADIVSPDGNWTLDLAVGASATLTHVLTADATATTGLNVVGNTATITSIAAGATLINTADDVAKQLTSLVSSGTPVFDLVVSVVESSDPVIVGVAASNLSYSIEVKNEGPDAASSMILANTLGLPTGVAVDNATVTSGSYNSAANIWSLGNLNSGESQVLTLDFTVDQAAAVGVDAISNNFQLFYVGFDTNPVDNSGVVLTSIAREVDLVVSTTESIDPVVAGSGVGNLVYLTTVTNTGVSDASGVVINSDLSLPTGVTRDSVAASAGSFADTILPDGDWTLDLPVGATATLKTILTVDATAVAGTDVISHTATVTSAGGGATLINTADDVAVTLTSVATTVGNVDLAVAVTESADPVVAGAGLTYTVSVTNNGTVVATGVALTEVLTLPTGVTINTITPSVGTYDPVTDPTNTWTLGSVASGATETLTIELDVDSSTASGIATISQTATISAVSEVDTNPANDTATEATDIARSVDITLTQSASSPSVSPGAGVGALSHVVTVSNLGTSDATGVVIDNVTTLPAGVTAGAVTPSGTTTFTGTTWTLGALPAGSSATLTISYDVGASAGAGTAIGNAATVQAVTETDSDPSSDTSTQSTPISTATLVDMGDAPAVYPTLLANNGAAHALGSGLFLGATVDADPDGQPSASSTGDDDDGINDEDGIVFATQLISGQFAFVTATSSGFGMIDAWVDFDRNGVFDAADQIFASQTVNPGGNGLLFEVPTGVLGGATHARFRLSSAGGLAPGGLAADGEVEDHVVNILGPAVQGAPAKVSISGKQSNTWTVDPYVISVPGSTNEELPWINLNTIEVEFLGATILTGSELTLYGTRATAATPPPVVTTTFVGQSGSTGTWSFANLADGYYRADVAGFAPISFSVLKGSGSLAASSLGVVNFLDFSKVAGNFGATTTLADGADLNGDGTVNFLDFSAVAGNFGNELPSPLLAPATPIAIAAHLDGTAPLPSATPVSAAVDFLFADDNADDEEDPFASA